MEITAFMIYLISVVDSINMLLTLAGVLCIGIMTLIMIFDDQMHIEEKRARTIWKRVAIIAIIIGILRIFTPSSTVLASMYIIPSIVNNEKIQAISNTGLDALYELSKTWLIELKEKK